MLDLLATWDINISNSTQSIQTIIFCLVLSFVIGMVITIVYRQANKGFSYEGSFNFTLLMVCMIVTTIMISIGSSVALSLGLIGALSIIRFRTVLKNTADMSYLFWSIAEELAVGAQNYYLAIIFLVFMTVIILILDIFNIFTKMNADYIVVINMSELDKKPVLLSKDISSIFTQNKTKWFLKSSFTDKENGMKELTYSVFSKKYDNIEQSLLEIENINGVNKVSLLSPESNLFI